MHHHNLMLLIILDDADAWGQKEDVSDFAPVEMDGIFVTEVDWPGWFCYLGD
jgi:hypothetical protein